MKKIFTLITLVTVLASCTRVPVTERRQVALLPEGQMLGMAQASYSDFLAQANVVRGTAESQMISTVGQRIATAVETYMRENNMSDRTQNFEWEFNLIQSDEVNAWAMPGGKIAFYTGILPVTQNEAGVAVVMGHEVAHAVARHGNERMSQMLLVEMGGIALDLALSERPEQTRNMFFAAYGAGATVGILLPYSRLHESEADRLGLIFMAMAGYQPQEAPAFWERMQQLSRGQAPPEFLSTHPSSERRINDLNAHMEEAMRFYRPR